ncbi:MAG: hypothetical protein OER04_02220 [Cyclobacteriaceae bacterium]|nr:hypothetical protein [Cyclobacteriaceae bacterium]
MRRLTSLLFLISFTMVGALGQQGPSVIEQNWDLSYQSVLNQNQIRWDHSVGTIFTWLADRDTESQYITRFIEEELGKLPQETFLLDHPTFPSAGRTTILGIRQGNQCYYWWRSTDEGMKEFKKRSLDPELFQQIVDHLHSMQQRDYESMGGPEKAYAGFMSVFKDGQGKQILLHINDFMEFDNENQQILRVGKISEIETTLLVKNN